MTNPSTTPSAEQMRELQSKRDELYQLQNGSVEALEAFIEASDAFIEARNNYDFTSDAAKDKQLPEVEDLAYFRLEYDEDGLFIQSNLGRMTLCYSDDRIPASFLKAIAEVWNARSTYGEQP